MTAGPGTVEFWFDLASTYSYLSASRIDAAAEAAGVSVQWRPFVLGAIFKQQNWDTSPFVLYPAKGKYMWRDVQRRAASYGLSARKPATFPQNSVHAHRLALVGLEQGWGRRFVMEVFQAEFAAGADIAQSAVLEGCVARAGGDPREALEKASSEAIRSELRAQTERAMAEGIFGAPTFVAADELFWGDDRLDEALRWARGAHPLQMARDLDRRPTEKGSASSKD